MIRIPLHWLSGHIRWMIFSPELSWLEPYQGRAALDKIIFFTTCTFLLTLSFVSQRVMQMSQKAASHYGEVIKHRQSDSFALFADNCINSSQQLDTCAMAICSRAIIRNYDDPNLHNNSVLLRYCVCLNYYIYIIFIIILNRKIFCIIIVWMPVTCRLQSSISRLTVSWRW